MGLDFSLHYFEDDTPTEDRSGGVKHWYWWSKPYFGKLGRYFLQDMAHTKADDGYWLKPDWWKVKSAVEDALIEEVKQAWDECEKECEKECVFLRRFRVEEMIRLLEAIDEMHDMYDLEKVWISWSV